MGKDWRDRLEGGKWECETKLNQAQVSKAPPPSQDAETSLRLDLALARKSGFCFGVKLVRGAYMEQEREKAGEKGYASPIWPGKEETDANYHRLLRWLISEVEPNRLHMMVASHNEQTVQLATRL